MALTLSTVALIIYWMPLAMASEPSTKFLQRTPPLQVDSAQGFIEQLTLVPTDVEGCRHNESRRHVVSPKVYGQIRQPKSLEAMIPLDKVVTWLVDGQTLSGWLNDRCCGLDSDPDQAGKQCLCGIAADVEVPVDDSASYQIVAFDASPALQPISPTWMNFHEAGVLPQTYEWVFGELEKQGKLAITIDELKSCQPNLATWAKLNWFNAYRSPGVEAYKGIMEDPVYGLAGQMGHLNCSSTVEEWSGGCGCRGASGCEPESDIELFCGSGPLCDPRPFLCPSTDSGAALPVGFVRAYLHKFLDAYPAFKGTGFTDSEMKTKEFFVVSSIYLSSGSLAMTSPQSGVKSACPA
eukprot:CAMPEP_0177221504 /NCGR_PEP_ID=MMETSP0367-20130122/37450_1 /TAXON_ID=447022 ORGANISM="Scrippsiella hangoei-like, Strain SHHI-4" /NCGR_SAMPLE_ID=MMETSP0367 /ASSEMBLY_ACC=CAM_ASM_000362 /LENGTH=350 /DNA_ID=CAMNT_0018671339 /DNA_START=63 /DNA_END=1118 /DNA_ORIENTATION=-